MRLLQFLDAARFAAGPSRCRRRLGFTGRERRKAALDFCDNRRMVNGARCSHDHLGRAITPGKKTAHRGFVLRPYGFWRAENATTERIIFKGGFQHHVEDKIIRRIFIRANFLEDDTFLAL